MSVVYNTKPTVSVRQFIPRIQAALSGIDVEMAAQFIVDAAISFAKDTRVLQDTISITLVCGQDSYRLDTPYTISEVISVRGFSDNTCGIFTLPDSDLNAYVDGGVLYVSPTPQAADSEREMEVVVAMVPKRNASTLPEVLYEEWAEAITFLALSKLYLLADASWYNLGASRENHAWYKQHMITAKMSNITKHKPLSIRLAPRYIRGRR